jgi:BirA family biotin operon repressor/biotin-[acetyl-CoA-carboxylase] ligase
MRNIAEKPFDLNLTLHALCNHIERRYLQLKAGQYEQIKSDYLKSLYRYNEFHQFEFGGQRFKAKIIDVSDEGKLVLQYENKLTGRYDFKSIKFVIKED